MIGILLLKLYKNTTLKKVYFIIIIIQLSLISGLRGYDVGSDTNNYISYFNTHSYMSLQQVLYSNFDIERGYVFLEFLISKISNDPTVLFLIIALFFIFAVGRMIFKHSSEPILSFILFVCLGFFSLSMSGMRQIVALGFIILSFEFIKKRKVLPFILIVLIGSLFHLSALVFLPAYFIAYKKFTTPYIIFAVMLIPTVYIFKNSIFGILSTFSGYEYAAYENAGPYTLLTLMILIFIAGIIQIKSIIKKNRDNIVYYNFLLVSILLAIMTFINPSALRAAYYYFIFIIIFIPEIILSFQDKNMKILFYYISIVLVILLYLKNLNLNSPYVPYDFFWK
ncbi:EpsG family protein [Sporosarcina sp. FA9]|uniref:EpsG family protein n=1 Tax=Sporosarcina sp. FA9 TaxID=3413030 RepID=UPI003F65FBFA